VAGVVDRSSLLEWAVSSGGRNTSYSLEAVLSSLRRVKKGPGRRPLSAKRQRFMELRGRGWSILAAAREVGVSRTTANNWSRGYKMYRHGQVVGFVPALERLAGRATDQLEGRLPVRRPESFGTGTSPAAAARWPALARW
jgi:hypothetical protein